MRYQKKLNICVHLLVSIDRKLCGLSDSAISDVLKGHFMVTLMILCTWWLELTYNMLTGMLNPTNSLLMVMSIRYHHYHQQRYTVCVSGKMADCFSIGKSENSPDGRDHYLGKK